MLTVSHEVHVEINDVAGSFPDSFWDGCFCKHVSMFATIPLLILVIIDFSNNSDCYKNCNSLQEISVAFHSRDHIALT